MCAQLMCSRCSRPGSLCACEVPRFAEEQCIVCDLTLDATIENVACGSCWCELPLCACADPRMYFMSTTCDDENIHEFKLEVNWRGDFDEPPVTCGVCNDWLEYDQQIRCDAEECTLEPIIDGCCIPRFFHERCLGQAHGFQLCPACIEAGNIPGDCNDEDDGE